MFILSIIERITRTFALSYGSELEQYITSHEPKSEADVERLTNQYLYRKNKSFTFRFRDSSVIKSLFVKDDQTECINLNKLFF
jgi:hypothetical protein